MRARVQVEHLSVLVVAGLLLAMAGVSPIEQPTRYHAFADTRAFLAIPNFWDVFSNFGFLAAGGLGLWLGNRTPVVQRGFLFLFATGLVLTALGSGVYHHNPNNETLVWDRIPMVIAFAGALGAMACQYIHPSAGWRWQNAWLYLGVVSIAYWVLTGDLRLYLVAQYGGFLLGAIWMLAGHKNNPEVVLLPWHWVWLGYLVAKLFEAGDLWLWQASHGLLAGHGIKHWVAAAGILPLWRVLWSKAPKG